MFSTELFKTGEHEYLLPRNQKYTIIEVDHNPQNPTAKILVY